MIATESSNSVTKISKEEWRWVSLVSLLTVALAALPVVWAWLATPNGEEFGGFLFNAHDGNTYLAKMAEGRRGDWVFHLAHTSETGGGGAVTFVFYLLLGKLAGLLNLSNLLVFHLARLVFGLTLLLISYRFVAWLFQEPAQRRFTFGLVCLSAGIGWLLAPLGLIPSPAPDLLVAEGFTFHSIFANPHFPLATTLLVLAIWTGQLALEKRFIRYYLWAALLAFGMGFVHPFLLVTLGAVLGVSWLRQSLTSRQFDGRSLAGLVAIGLAGAPGPFLTWWGTQNDPLLRTWMSQNQVPSPGPLALLAGYGLLVPLAVAGAWWVERWLPAEAGQNELVQHWRLVTNWVVVTVILLLVPVGFGLKFIEGIHLPICCLAGAGWYNLIQPRLAKRRRKLARQFLVLLTAISSLTLVVTAISYIYTPTPRDNLYELLRPPYLSTGEVGAIQWLQQHSQTGEVVLSGPILGNVLPGRVGIRAFWGHSMETINPSLKATILEQFYDPATSVASRAGIIKAWNLKYLVQGWRERELGAFDPSTTSWPVVYNQAGVQIYLLS